MFCVHTSGLYNNVESNTICIMFKTPKTSLYFNDLMISILITNTNGNMHSHTLMYTLMYTFMYTHARTHAHTPHITPNVY